MINIIKSLAKVGAIMISVKVGLDALKDAFTEDDFSDALMDAGLAAIMAGALAKLAFGASFATVALGTFIFEVGALIAWRTVKNYKQVTGNIFADTALAISEAMDLELNKKIQNPFTPAIEGVKDFSEVMKNTITLDVLPLLAQLGHWIGSPTKASFPLVYALKVAEAEWVIMKDVAVANIDDIIAKLNDIPKEISVVVKIRTEVEGGGRFESEARRETGLRISRIFGGLG